MADRCAMVSFSFSIDENKYTEMPIFFFAFILYRKKKSFEIHVFMPRCANGFYFGDYFIECH